MVAQTPDMIVYDATGKPYMAVEVNNQIGLTAEMATRFRKEVVPRLIGASTPYLMLASQERGYFWNRNDSAPAEAPPDLEFPMDNVVAHYRPAIDQDKTRRLRGSEVEILVWHWLVELAWKRPSAPIPEGLAPLLTPLHGGNVTMESNS